MQDSRMTETTVLHTQQLSLEATNVFNSCCFSYYSCTYPHAKNF